MTEIEPCFYCESGHLMIKNIHSGNNDFRVYCPCCGYVGGIKTTVKEAIEKHNFIANAVKTLKNIKEKNLAVISQSSLNYLNESNWLKTDTALTWKQPMKSIFDMTEEELKELHHPIILPGFGIRQGKLTPTVQYIKLQEPNASESFSINKEMNSNQYKALKSIIDHEISYLEQKEKEAKDFKVGWVYKDSEGNEILIVSINSRFFPYGVLGFWLSSHWCRFSTYTLEGFSSGVPELESSKSLILSTGKKWGPIE